MGTPDILDTLRAWVAQIVREELSRTPSEVLTTAEAAAVAKVSKKTICRWVQEGRLEDRGAGREVRVARDELENIMRPGKKRAGRLPRKATPAKSLSPEERAMRDAGL